MASTTSVDNSKLSPWYFGVNWATMIMKERIKKFEKKGWDATYDRKQLAYLEDLEQFLKMSWDTWLNDMEENAVRIREQASK
ncbi:MAG: hypothetical protein EBV86_12935 [Marivivens sp.]|jgi:hypothetical protein|nr:hypothetical protein [Marivivens sp.]NCW69442.1 hypothetical protein [Marivivens sp.]